jgi:putative oxidoreductase
MVNYKRCLQPTSLPNCGSAALLLVRVVVGLAFVYHGWGKIQNPMAWMGPEAPVPGILQFLAALSEFGGGIAWILGLLAPLASLGIAFTMAVAVYFHMVVNKDPFVNLTGGSSYELAAVYLSIAILFLVLGVGKFSADAKLFGQKP